MLSSRPVREPGRARPVLVIKYQFRALSLAIAGDSVVDPVVPALSSCRLWLQLVRASHTANRVLGLPNCRGCQGCVRTRNCGLSKGQLRDAIHHLDHPGYWELPSSQRCRPSTRPPPPLPVCSVASRPPPTSLVSLAGVSLCDMLNGVRCQLVPDVDQ